jgi:predicted transcriptional regulator
MSSVEWVNETTFIIPLSRKRVVSLRLDSDVVNRYDRLVAKLRLRNIKITRTALLELILTKAIERPELIADLVFNHSQ